MRFRPLGLGTVQRDVGVLEPCAWRVVGILGTASNMTACIDGLRGISTRARARQCGRQILTDPLQVETGRLTTGPLVLP